MAALSGVYLLQRVVPPGLAPHRPRCAARRALAQLHRDVAGTRTVPRFSRDYPPTLTAHDVGIKDLLDLFYMLDGGREVILYAISIDPIQQISLELSSGIKRAANEAVERILGELAPPAAPSSYHTGHSP